MVQEFVFGLMKGMLTYGSILSGICIGGLSVGFLGSCGRVLYTSPSSDRNGEFECWVLDSPQWVSSMPVAENASTGWGRAKLRSYPPWLEDGLKSPEIGDFRWAREHRSGAPPDGG